MNAEQKQRAIDLLACFDEKESYGETRYVEAFALLQELIDEPEQATKDVLKDVQISSLQNRPLQK